METVKDPLFPLALTFDDILLLPGYSDFSRADIDLSTKLTKKIFLRIPLVSAPMDTVTDSKLAIALAELGGIGIIHRNLSISDQADEVEKVKKREVLVGAAIGASNGFEERACALIKAQADVILIDSAHGHTKVIIDAIKALKRKYPKTQVIAGSIATADGALALVKAGADGLRVGMGPGAICTTRVISGMGVPQASAILDTVKIARKYSIPVIADGGVKFSGDIVKALGLGAATVMMGSLFATCAEAPGKTIMLKRQFVPKRFQSIFNGGGTLLPAGKKNSSTVLAGVDEDGEEIYKFKEYRGMGSVAAMEKGAAIKSEDEFHGKSYKDRVLVAEGVEGLVPVRGTVKELLDQAIGGIKSGMYYTGAKNIKELWEKSRFIQITQASLTESHPHSILVTNAGENYS